MRYCANSTCTHRNDCIRYTLGRKFVDVEDYRDRDWRTRRPGAWVAYRKGGECGGCRQFIHKDYATKRHT